MQYINNNFYQNMRYSVTEMVERKHLPGCAQRPGSKDRARVSNSNKLNFPEK